MSVHGPKSLDRLEMIPDPNQWRLDPDLSGYGTTVMDIGIYPLDTTRFVLAEDPIAAQATMSSPDPGFDAVPDEHVAFTLEFPDHVYATSTASMRSAEKSVLRIVGMAGELRMEPAFFTDPSPTLYRTRSGTTAGYSLEPVDQVREEFDNFADRGLTGREIPADREHGLVDMRAIAAIYEAGETGETVQIP